MEIIQKITEQASHLSEQDLSWILPEIYNKYTPIIRNYSNAAKQNDKLAKAAFEENAKQFLNQAVKTFLFKKQHWKENKNLHFYLIKTLSNLKSEKIIENSTNKLFNYPICPLCKIDKHKEFLSIEDDFFVCDRCKDLSGIDSSYKNDLRKIFSKHSKKGVRCPDCKKWIPNSAFKEGIMPCIYNCGFIGYYSEYKVCSHPVSLRSNNKIKSLNDENFQGRKLEDTISSYDISGQDKIHFNESLENEYNIILNVLLQQQKMLYNTCTQATLVQKKLMYQAFINILKENPYDMTMYLGHQKNVSKTPLQCRIFQEYADLILNYMPFDIIKGKNKSEIIDPCDPRLSLFLGISTYDAIVGDNGIVPNQTKENYIGGKQIKDYGPCFIGKLISVSSGNISIDNVEYYTFNEIKTNLDKGTKVQVKHFRIPSHYEMHSLVFLQRIRRAVVDKVYLLLNKEKRIIKK